MKTLLVTLAMMAASVASSAQQKMEMFKEFAGCFSESASFAYAEVGGRVVLLVSHETFGNNANSNLEAVETSIFALDKEGKIVALGSIRSQGTLYPISLLDGKLMSAGHQFVRIYSIRGEMPELVLDEYGDGDYEMIQDKFKKFEKGTPILFSKKLNF